MSAHNVYAGEARFPRGRCFHPKGQLQTIGTSNAHEGRRKESLSRLAARFFIGLNVGTETKWTEQNVIDAVVRIRAAQGARPGASFLLQRGIYEDQSRRIIDEPSVQIIVIDYNQLNQEVFTEEMISLGEQLAREFQQEEVLLEIQRRGVVEDQYTLTPD